MSVATASLFFLVGFLRNDYGELSRALVSRHVSLQPVSAGAARSPIRLPVPHNDWWERHVVW